MAENRRITDSEIETIHLVRMTHLNSAGRLFGGMLMQWIDEVAALVAKKHSRMNITTVSIDHLQFLRGAYLDDAVVLQGKVTYVGRTSMDVKVETYIEDKEGIRTLINCAYLTEVALDKNGKPAQVPGLLLETEEDKKEWAKGERRRELRTLHG
ncbi:MAG: acyl-CoA thioesterase [Eubacteriales bacterium]|nr:acyl-CoA thioesterase [Eubacteriales bacterium]